MTSPDPFPTAIELWAAFEVLHTVATNNAPAVNGSRFQAISSGGDVQVANIRVLVITGWL